MAQQKLWAWTCGVLAISLFLCVWGASGEDMDDDFTLPGASDFTLPPIVSDFDSLDEHQSIADWRERCKSEVGEQAVKDIEDSQSILMACVSEIIKWDKLQHEINRSIPRGELDLVFKKYCGRRESLMVCVEDAFTKLNLCLNERERRDLNVTREAIDAGLDFVCHNDGDRIALFMGEKGGECVKSQKENIRNCVEERVPDMKEVEHDPGSISFTSLAITEENCKKIDAMRQCVVEWTEKCKDSTPANILNSLIGQILKVTPCKQTSGATTGLVSSGDLMPRMLTLFVAALTAANMLL